MESSNKRKAKIDPDEVLEYIDSHMKCTYSPETETPFPCALFGETFARLSVETLKKCPVTPESAALIAKLYLMQFKKPISAVILLKKNMMIKDIVILSKGFRPYISEFIPEIIKACTKNRVKKCIVIYNFEYKKRGLENIFDLSNVHDILKDRDISLVDAVCFHKGTTTNIVHSINPDTYN